MKILFVLPKYPATFWSFKYALPFVGKKAAFPPLGLLTVASMLPQGWEKKLIDLNVQKLNDEDIEWADFVFISAMIIQKDSSKEIIKRLKGFNKKIVAGGPLFTTGYEEFLKEVEERSPSSPPPADARDIDYFILGEAEETLPLFLEDFKKGVLKKIYKTNVWPDIRKTPLPSWGLIDFDKYASMSVQYSRGCPFNCEFCDIVLLNGRTPRTKSKEQILGELDELYKRGWRGNIFFVDDNFIGNKDILKKEILPAMIEWMENKKHPFYFNTQASINLADDEELMNLMTKAGFDTVFIGIESPEEKCLKECGKFQNTNRDLLSSVKAIQNRGLQVQAGFIVGFDQDEASIFDRTIDFIQKSKIMIAMVGLLQAAPKTKLWERLKKEKRLLNQPTGDNTDCTTNFSTNMNNEVLIRGYKRVLNNIYAPRNYYQRLINFLKEYKFRSKADNRIDFGRFLAFLKSILVVGLKEKERLHYWKLFFWCLFKKPKLFPLAIEMAIKGFHLRKISENYSLRP